MGQSEVADDTKLGGVANTPVGCAAMQSISRYWGAGLTETSCSSTREIANSCTWGGTSLGTSFQLGTRVSEGPAGHQIKHELAMGF